MAAAPDGEPAAPLAILNHPPTRLSGPQYLHELVRTHGVANDVAIDFLAADGKRSSLSYRELHQLSDHIAGKITASRRQRSLNGQFTVPILAPQHPSLYVALLAILKAGGAFCPLNLDAPPERVKFILQDVAATIIITTSEFASVFPADDSLVVLLLDDEVTQEILPFSSPGTQKVTDLAYVMYTSGSTGTPKGVGVSHDAATQSLLAHHRHIPSFSRFLQFAAPTFDVSVFEIFFPLFRGSTLVSCHRARLLDDLPSVIRTMDIDACELTPSVAGSLLRKRENAPCLKLLLTIGEMLTRPVIEEFGGGDGRPSILWAMYGPTEAAIHCSLQPALSASSSVGNIGFPLETVSVFVLKLSDDSAADWLPRVAAVGEVGELAVGGYQLASGYLNRPETTSFAFINSPYGPLYRTLDKAKILPDGTIECFGRIGGGQVKLRGQRIELGEVEQVALRTPGCHGAVGAVIQGILVLFCDIDGQDDMATRVRKTCESWLPGFMVPGDIVTFRGFPRLASGKVDRRQMVSDYSQQRERDLEQVQEFQDDEQRTLCQLAGKVLGREIGPTTSLAAAGLDSLLAIKFTAELRQAGFNPNAMDVLGSKSISQLRTLIVQQEENPAEVPATTEENRAFKVPNVEAIAILADRLQDVQELLPCTPLQAAMLAETASNPRAYCNWLELSVPGDHDFFAIRSWIEDIAKKNEIFRTGFVLHRGEFLQVLWKEPSSVSIFQSDHLSRDFNIETEEQYLHPLNVQICRQENESRVLLQMHHSLFDGWTVDMLLADVNTFSEGGQPVPRPQFRQVVEFTQSSSFLKEYDTSRTFWAQNLSGLQLTSLPKLLDAIPEQVGVESRVISLDLSPDSVKKTLQELELSPQVLFQAALAWLWSSLVGNEDIVTGFVTSGRTSPVAGITDIMGPCIATLPLRTNLSQTRTISDLFASIQSGNRSAMGHSSLPLNEIKKAAGIVPGQTLYDVVFVYQESLYSGTSRDEDAVREVAHLDYLETKLLVEVEPKQGTYECRLTYHTNMLLEAHVMMIGEDISCIAQHMLANHGSELASTRGVFPEHLLSTYNLQPRSFTGTPDLARAVENVVSKTPDKTAVWFATNIERAFVDGQLVSYCKFNAMANKIARYIRAAGCFTGDVVAIIMEKSVLLYAGILGIVKAGCSYLPLLSSTPMARIELILAQAGVKFCLTDHSSAPKLSLLKGCDLVDLEERQFDTTDDTNLEIPADPHRVAVIVYTSGSTGVPKGVCVTQLNVMSNLDVLSRIYPVKNDSALLQSCSQAFDVSVFEMFFAWTQGMSLCSARNDTLFEDLEHSIRTLRVTHLSMTPTVASLVDPQNVPGVEFLVTSGEPMTEKVARSWCRQLYQGYGPSETTNICTIKRMGPSDVIQHLGHSFENTSTVVLHQDSLEPVPRGCLGELCFGGDQVAQGYLNMPELTSTKFIDHPTFGRLYRSGDIGRMLPDGSLAITGRVDDQIKLRGLRIELNEINTTVGQSDMATDCITILVTRDEPSHAQLASFYVPRDYADCSMSEVMPLKDHMKNVNTSLYRLLAAKLPNYMVPAYMIPISKLPLTASGKIDRAWFLQAFHKLDQAYLELASMSTERHHDSREWTDTERIVAEIVSSVLALQGASVARWTPLISYGLDSISAIGLSKQIEMQLGRRIPVSLVLQNACVAQLAKALSDLTHDENRQMVSLDVFAADWVNDVKAEYHSHGRTIEKILPCTPLQEAMLASSGKGQFYFNSMLFRLYTDPSAMRRYWTTMCDRHCILRTCFVSSNGPQHPFAQVVLSGWQPRWWHYVGSEGTLDDCINQHLAGRPDVLNSREPLVSFAIIEQQNSTYLSFICHHALYDGIAIEQLLHEVELVANGISLAPAPVIEPFLQAILSESPPADNFWKAQLRNFRPTELPVSKESGNGETTKTHDIKTTRVSISLGEINRRTKNLGFSLLSVCQAAWTLVLTILLEVDDISFGSVVSCRSVEVDGIERLVAPCFNTVPIRMDLSNIRQNADLMKALNALNPQVMQHQRTSLRRIQSLASRGQHQRLFDTILILQQPARSLDHNLWTLERDDGEMDIPLVCEFRPDTQRDVLTVQLHYECSYISKALIEVISNLLQHCINACLNYPSSRILTHTSLPPPIADRLSKLRVRRVSSVATDTPATSVTETWAEPESQIRATLASLSSTPQASIRRHTTIYQLGLDSINAVQIASLLRKQGINVSASDVIEQKTCANLAQKASTSSNASNQPVLYDLAAFRRRAETQLGRYRIPCDSVDTILPCTSLQAGMLVRFIQSEGHDYFNFIDFELDGSVKFQDMKNAWADVSDGHAMLRTGFIPVDDTEFPFAMVQYSAPVHNTVSLIDSTTMPHWSIDKWWLDMADEVLNKLQSPPWRVVFRDHGSHLTMHLAIHHAIYDAESLQGLLLHLAARLRGEDLPMITATEDAVMDIINHSFHADMQEAFWKAKSGDVVINQFPILTPLRVDSKTSLVESMISSRTFTNLETSLRSAGVTMQAALQAAWTRILSSYLGESSVVFGVVLSGRTSEATKDAFFPCITTLPVISSNCSSNRELLQSMLDYSGSIYKQQHLPLTKIHRLLGYPDDRVFDTLLVYQKRALRSDSSLPWEVLDDRATVDYPVSIEVEPTTDDRLLYRLTFAGNVIPSEQAKLLLEQFDLILCDLAMNPNGQEDDLVSKAPNLYSITPPQEREIRSPVKFLHHFVETQAIKTPEKTALQFVTEFQGDQPVGKTWSYRALDKHGNQVARLIQPCVRTGDTVAIYFDKCPEAFFSILGVLKVGCAFVALDPGSPPARKRFILEDSRASVILISKDLERDLDFSTDIPVIVIDEESLLTLDGSPVTLKPELTPQDTCYCLYTSGTTGTPKGCEITHENAVQAMLAFQRLFEGHWDATSKWLQFASFHFDVAVLEQYWSWSVGITLTAAPRDLILEDLAGTISRLDITHIDLTPSLARLLSPEEVPSLMRGVFITGGEQLKQEILDAWGSKGVIYNAYGPTEATIGVTTYPRVPQTGRASNIGRQFVNVGTYVLKPGTETPVLRGGLGELCISGKLVGRGYLGRDDLTAERFPTLERFKERVYRTGDLVRILYDGCFDFLGRADDQIKLRGQRLELGEINHAIRSAVPEVTDVATLVVRNEKQRKDTLVSFVATETDGKVLRNLGIVDGPSAAELSKCVQDACRQRLPGYMVPTYVIVLPFIPLSSNNKAETKKLKTLFADLDHKQLVALTSPVSEVRTGLDDVGHEVLRVLTALSTVPTQEADSNTTIFEFGIDSISVVRLSESLKRAGFPQASPSLILTHPRVADLAQQLSFRRTSSGQDHTLAAKQVVQACQHKYRGLVERELGIDAESIEYIAPCSPLQEGMISRSNMPVGEGTYFNTFRWELSSQVSSLQLQKAWTKLIGSCSILRTRFVRTTDGYVQVATKTAHLPWKEVYISAKPDLEPLLREEQHSWVQRNSHHHVKQPLELILVKIGEETRLMIVNISHGIYDAISLDILMDQLRSYYLELPITVSAPSYLEALVRGPLRSYAGSKDFWVEHLKSASPQSFPVICTRPATKSISCNRLVSVGGLESLPTALGVTHQAIMQAVWVSVIQKFLKSVTIGVVISGRSIELEGAESVIGPLFNTVAFHASLGPGETWLSLIKQCHAFNIAIIPFQHVALRDVQKWCSDGRPLFDTLFSFQREPERSNDDQLWTLLESPPNPDFALAFEATLTTESHLRLQLVAKAGIADMDTLSSLLDQVEVALQSILTPEQRVPLTSHCDDGIITQNGTGHEVQVQNVDSFEWTETALAIRDEVASLVDSPAEGITANMSLLELGLDSIDLIKLSSRLRKRGITLTTTQLMREQVISAMVQQLRPELPDIAVTISNAEPAQSMSTALREHLLRAGHNMEQVEDVLPVTPLQDAMVAEMVQSEFHRYFNHDVLELDPLIDILRLQEAWSQVIANSPILRTTFLEIDSPDIDMAYCQVIYKMSPLLLEQVTVSGKNELQQVMESARTRAYEACGRSSLLQLAVVTVGERRYLVLSISHALYDGWSLGIIHRDVKAAYYGSYMAAPSYKGYLNSIITASTSAAKHFWSGFLAGAQETLVQDREQRVAREEVHRIEATSPISPAALKNFCRRHGVSVQVVGQACWSAVLASRTKSLDVAFGVVLSGRDTEEAEELLFPTMNTVVVRSILHGTTVSWLRYMQENMTNIGSFQHVPLRDALKLVGRSRGPLFNTLFIQQRAQNSVVADERPWMTSVGGNSSVEYPVCVEVEMSDEHLRWRTACESRYLSRKDTAKLLHHLDVVLRHFVNSPTADVLTFSDGQVSVCGLPSFSLAVTANDGKYVDVPSDIADAAPWSETESQIRSAISQVSGVPISSVEKSHTVYHLGVDSISAIKVTSLLRKWGITLSVRQVLGAKSISDMASMATGDMPADEVPTSVNGAPEAVGAVTATEDSITRCLQSLNVPALLADARIDEALIEEVLPATAMQVHMLSVWQNTSGTIFYPEFAYSLRGSIGIETISPAWSALLERHAILRTGFLPTKSRQFPFLQIIYRSRPQPADMVNEPDVWNSQTYGSLASIHVSCVSKGHWSLRLKIHHALYDGISLPIIMDTFRQLCQGVLLGTPVADLSLWKKWLSTHVSVSAQRSRKAFWTEYLRDANSSPFPARTALPPSSNARTAFFKQAVLNNIESFQFVCAEYGVSLQALFFSAYAQFMAERVGASEDIAFGIYLANRTSMDRVDRLPYPTLSLVPLRVRQPASRDIVSVARTIQANLHDITSLAKTSVGLWEILDWTGVKVDSFVNFLPLPDIHEPVTSEGIALEESPPEEHSEAWPATGRSLAVEEYPSLSANLVRDAYLDAIDIEVSVSGDVMNIGVFGPSTILDTDGAKEVVSGIVAALMTSHDAVKG